MITEEKINKNFILFQEKMKENDINVEKMTEEIGDKIKNAAFSMNIDSGTAYRGSLIQTLKEITSTAIRNNEMLPEKIQVNKKSLIKVCFLHQIAKSEMFTPTKDDWKRKRGIEYDFTDYGYALRNGMRSVALCLKYGITFNDEELEAMTIMDRSSDDEQSRYMSSMMAVLVREANFIVMTKNRLEELDEI